MKKIYSLLLLTILITFPVLAQRQMEKLDRGLVAVKVSSGVYLSWRILGTDDKNVQFNIYKNETTLVNSSPISAKSNYSDTSGKLTDTYTVDVLLDGKVIETSKPCTPWGQQYLTVQLDRPAAGVTPPSYFDNRSSNSSNRVQTPYPDGEEYTYTPNDMSIADLDGDGEYELIVKWDPSNSKDNSYSGMTGNVYIDAYKLNGTKLWRIDLGRNIRAGAHYTQFMVYDFDGDGVAEIICKTALGTVDGKGNNVIMGSDDPNADYRTSTMNSNNGYVLNGPEYLTVFDGQTGEEVHTIAYEPVRDKVSDWGDSYGNRVDRFLACVAYLDGVKPSVVMCRGYYTRATLAAYDYVNKKLVRRWFYDSGKSASKSNAFGQGTHSLAVGDVDGDGFDEIIYGSAAIDHDGKLLYNTQYGHGDAGHLSDMDPDRPGLEYFQPHETSPYGFHLRDAGTGEIIYNETSSGDNARGLAADVDPANRGFEFWSSASSNVYNVQTKTAISTRKPSTNFRIYWDGDLQDELLDGNRITKWRSTASVSTLLTMSGCSSNNSTKATPNISADILGDWREEVILYETADPSKVRIYTTTTPSDYGFYTLMHDPIYRLAIAWQNVAYNQPPHLGFYIGDGLANIPTPNIYTPVYDPTGVEDGNKVSSVCHAYISMGQLNVNSDSMIKSVSVYNLYGLLVQQYSSVEATSFNESLPSSADNLYIVRVLTEAGVKTFKLVRR